jgi:4-amino-4-deoxy-L-arabinose transferase-like glycosyltransferase
MSLITQHIERCVLWFQKREAMVLWAVFGVILLIRLVTLGLYPLMDTTESRYAKIALEMVVTNNWITPQLEPGVPFWGKPPLSTWATAIAFKIFGVSEFSARLSSFLFALLTLWLVYFLANFLKGGMFALRCLVILASTWPFFIFAGGVMTDPAFSVTVTLAMVSFILAMHHRKDGEPSLIWGYLFFVGAGLSVLAKGPAGLILIGFPIVVWVVWTKKIKDLFRSLPWIGGIGILLLVILPWYVMAEIKTPGFIDYFIVGENFKRFFVHGWKGDLYGRMHSQPLGMIWLFIIGGSVPWLSIWIGSLIKTATRNHVVALITQDSRILFLILWFMSLPVFFTVSKHILITYMLPVMPAFAILTAYYIEMYRSTENRLSLPWFVRLRTIVSFALYMPVIFFFLVLFYSPAIGQAKSHKAVATYFKALDKDANSKLIYLDKRPYSADFYAHGQSSDISNLSHERILQYVREHAQDYYVIRHENRKNLPQKIFDCLTPVKEYREYSLYESISPHRLNQIH